MKVLVWITAFIVALVSMSELLNSVSKKSSLDNEDRKVDFLIGIVSFIVLVIFASFVASGKLTF